MRTGDRLGAYPGLVTRGWPGGRPVAWTEARAAVWRASAPSGVEPGEGWQFAGGAAVFIAMISAPSDIPCGAPGAECGTSQVLALVLPLLAVTWLFLMMMPWLAVLTSGIAATVAMVFWFPVVPGVIVWPPFSVALAVWLWHLRSQARAQGRIASCSLEPVPPALVAALRQMKPRRIPWDGTEVFGAAVVAMAIAVAPVAYWAYVGEAAKDDASYARSITVDATVTQVEGADEDDDAPYAITLRLAEDIDGLPREIEVEPWVRDHVVGDTVQILFDPERPTWTRLADEPPDHFILLFFAHVVALGGLAALVLLINARRSARRMGQPLVCERAIAVLVDSVTTRRGATAFHVRCVDTESSFATIDVHIDDPLTRLVLPTPEPGYLIGGLTVGDPARVVVATGEASDVTMLSYPESSWREDAATALKAGLSGPTPVPYHAHDDFRWRPRRWGRVAGTILGGLALVVPFATYPWVGNTWLRAGIAVAALALVLSAIRIEAPEVLLDDRRFTRRGMWRYIRIPTWAVVEVSLTHRLIVELVDNLGERIELDLGERGWEFADRMAGFIDTRTTSPDPSTPGTSFAETAQVWRRFTVALIPAVMLSIAAAWVFLG